MEKQEIKKDINEEINKQERTLFVKNFVWNILGTGFNSFNSLFFLIIVTWINGVEQAGIYSIAYATALILYTVALYSGRLCQVTDTENKVTDKDYIGNRIFTCVVTMLIAIIFAVFIQGYRDIKLWACILLTFYKATEALSEIFYGIMQKNDILYKSGQSLTIKSLLGLIVFLIVDIITKNLILSIIASILVNVVTIMFFDIVIIKILVDKDEKFNKSNVFRILKTDFFVFANSFAGIYVLNAPKYAIESYGTDELQAMFGYIIMPATVIVLFAQFVFMPFLNKLKNLYAEKNMKEFKRIARNIKLAVLAFGVFAVGAGYLLGPEVLKLIYGVEDLLNYRVHLAVILAAYIGYGISYVNLILLTTTRDTFVQFVIYVLTMGVAAIGSNVLVSKFLIDGAVMSCMLTLASQFIMYSTVTSFILRKITKKFEKEKEVVEVKE